jgi:DNA-binding helix-hairpin-helix protein with protein kinase domain
MARYITINSLQFELAEVAIASGGEGEIFHIYQNGVLQQNTCVKLYYPEQLTKARMEKLSYMIKHPPTAIKGDCYALCWPRHLVYENDVFVGFEMPFAFKESIQLYELCTLNLVGKLNRIWEEKFVRGNLYSLLNRMKLCVNIAIGIMEIHEQNNYVFVDVKPQNILVNPDGQISIVDLDSMQISKNEVVVHSGQVATPEYTPKEGEGLSPLQHFIPETWDRFSMAVIFYELMFGIHPFIATSKGSYRHITTIEESIKNGLFVFGSKQLFLDAAPPHEHYKLLPKAIQNYFSMAFDANIEPSERPSAKQWATCIANELTQSIEYLNFLNFGAKPQQKPKVKQQNESKNIPSDLALDTTQPLEVMHSDTPILDSVMRNFSSTFVMYCFAYTSTYQLWFHEINSTCIISGLLIYLLTKLVSSTLSN